jgi:3-oxoacyl-[acyl-carrier protein] reductase
MELNNKKIIITGGAEGLGKAVAVKLADMNAKVSVLDINPVGKELDTFKNIEFYNCDITDFNNVQNCVDVIYKKYGEINILINNAAVIHNSLLISFIDGKLVTYNLADWNSIISTNINGTFHVTANVVQKMIENRTDGLVINVSSIASAGNTGQSAYSASKAALNALTVVWAKELSFYGIRIAGISPGFTETERTLSSMGENVIKDWKKKTLLRRMAKVEEMVEGILFIIKNDFFNARTLEIDGGLRI